VPTIHVLGQSIESFALASTGPLLVDGATGPPGLVGPWARY